MSNLLDSILDSLEQIVEQNPAAKAALEKAAPPPPQVPNMLKAFLDEPERVTAVQSIRRHPTVQAWRQELSDANVRADTVNKILGVIDFVLRMVATPGV
jgi:hypothetical protein